MPNKIFTDEQRTSLVLALPIINTMYIQYCDDVAAAGSGLTPLGKEHWLRRYWNETSSYQRTSIKNIIFDDLLIEKTSNSVGNTEAKPIKPVGDRINDAINIYNSILNEMFDKIDQAAEAKQASGKSKEQVSKDAISMKRLLLEQSYFSGELFTEAVLRNTPNFTRAVPNIIFKTKEARDTFYSLNTELKVFKSVAGDLVVSTSISKIWMISKTGMPETISTIRNYTFEFQCSFYEVNKGEATIPDSLTQKIFSLPENDTKLEKTPMTVLDEMLYFVEEYGMKFRRDLLHSIAANYAEAMASAVNPRTFTTGTISTSDYASSAQPLNTSRAAQERYAQMYIQQYTQTRSE